MVTRGKDILIKIQYRGMYSNLHIYVSNDRLLKHTKQKLTELKGEIDSSTIPLGDVNISLSTVDKTTRR